MTPPITPAPSERIRAAFLFCLLFVFLPLIYLNGIQQPEIALKMPLLAIGLAVFILWGFLLRVPEPDVGFLRQLPVAVFILFLAWQCVGLILSVNVGDAAIEIARLSLLLVLLLVLVRYLSVRPEWMNAFSAGPSLAALAVSCHGLVQLYLLRQESLATGEPFVINFAIGSSLGNKNSFAEFLLLCLPFILYSLVAGRRQFRWLHATALLLSLFLLFFLKSLATWSALAAAALCFFVLWRGRKVAIGRRVSVVLVLCGVLLLVSGFVFRQNIMTDSIRKKLLLIPEMTGKTGLFERNDPANNNSIFERMLLWRNTGKMIGDHPWIGVGTGNWKIYVYRYGILGTDFISSGLVHYEHPHNDFLLTFAETGPVGFLLLLLLFFALARDGILKARLLKDPADRDARLRCVLSVCVIVAFAVLSLFGYPWTKTVATSLLVLAAAFILAQPVRVGPAPTVRFKGFYLLLLAVLCWIAYVGYQRLRGEAIMYQVQLAKYAKEWPRMVRLLDKQQSDYFVLDAVATPVDWYSGLACSYQGESERAKTFLLEAARHHPYHLQICNDLGTLSEQEGKHDEALEYYSRALQISPFNVQASLNICAVFFNLHLADSAYAAIDRIYGCRIYGQEITRYNKSLPLVLYAVAYARLRNLPLGHQQSWQDTISQPGYLRRLYEESKRERVSFTGKLDALIHAGLKDAP